MQPAGDTAAETPAASKLFVQCSPALCRSVSAVDSGYNDRDDDDGGSSGSSVCSDSGSSIVSEAKDLVRRAHDQAATVAFEGNIVVENSTQVQFGNNTHYHGPVTVLLNSTKCVANGPPASAPPLAAVAQNAALPEQPSERSPEQTPEQILEQPTSRSIAEHADAAPKRKEVAVRWRCVALAAAAATALVVVIVLLCVVLPDKPGPNKIGRLQRRPRHTP